MIEHTKHTAQTAKAKFGREMRPCPHCGGYNLIARLWMKLDWDGRVEDGIAYIVCDGCRFRCKVVDFKGRMLDDVYKNKAIHDEIINLWNSKEEYKEMGLARMAECMPMEGKSFAERVNLGNQHRPALRWNSNDAAGTIVVESSICPADERFDRELRFEDISDVFGSAGMHWWLDPMDDEFFNELIKNAIVDTGAGDVTNGGGHNEGLA